MNTYKKLDVNGICDIVRSAEGALIICHANPDADALGSALAMQEIFSLLGKQSKIVTPTAPPRFLGFMTGGESFEYSENDCEKYSTLIAVDVASLSQLGSLAGLRYKITAMIDHHSNGEPFADNLIRPDAAACGEIIFKVYEKLSGDGIIPRSAKVCRCLFAALSSDTGSFKYSNTTPETLRVAADLMEEINSDGGMHTDEISRLLHDTVSKTDIAVASAVNSATEFYEDGSLAVCVITLCDMERGGFDESDLGGAVDIPRKIENVLVSVALKQQRNSPGGYKISARANCDIDVAAVCGKFGGGGHMRAAGGRVCADSPEEALKKVVSAFSPAVAAYKSAAGISKESLE